MKITVEDVHIAPNERRRQAEERVASREAKAREGRKVVESKEPALEEPERLIGSPRLPRTTGRNPLTSTERFRARRLMPTG